MRRTARWLSCAALVTAVLAATPVVAAAAVIVPDGGFDIHGSTADVERGIQIAHDAGARWVSLSASWESLEPQPDSYRTPGGPGTAAWDQLGIQLAFAKSRDMGVEIRLSNAPAWASGRSGVSDDPPTPSNVGAYADFLKDLAGRFGSSIDAYSPWNEPNRAAFWNPTDPDAFTALQKAAYVAIKGVDPSATVLYGPVVGRYAGVNSGYTFLRRSYQLGLKGYADAIGWNGYPGGPPESSAPVENGVPAGNTLPAQLYLRDLISQFDPGRKVWIMEMSWSTCGSSCNVSAANGTTEAQQADYLTRAFTYRRRYLSDITERIFWYELRDEGTDASNWFETRASCTTTSRPSPRWRPSAPSGSNVPDGQLTPGAPPPTTTVPSPAALPAAAARIGLPAAATSPTGGRVRRARRVRISRGFLTLSFRVRVAGGATALRIEGYRAPRWRRITTLTVRRSSLVRMRLADRGYAGIRVRGTVPGRRGFRVGFVLRIPKAQR